MKNKKKSSNAACKKIDFDDVDDVRLDQIKITNLGKNSSENVNCYSNLHTPSVENCEFCEKVFSNRYQYLIHNAKHIIIPLIKQKLYQCPECLYHFTAIYELGLHIDKKHSSPLLKTIKKEPELNYYHNDESLLGCDMKKEPLIEFEHDKIPTIKYEYDARPNNMAVNRNGGNIKNRIVFEDDILDGHANGLLNDLTTDCKVNLEVFDAPWLFNSGNNYQSDGSKFQSVHYDDLIKPGVFGCKRCYMTFPNRFLAIIHETTHLKARKHRPLLCHMCDRFISGNHYSLRKHELRKHRNEESKRGVPRPCQKCGLPYYRLNRHVKNYHNIYVCRLCGKRFESEEHREIHMNEDHKVDKAIMINQGFNNSILKTEEIVKNMRVCEICFMFFRNTQSCKYVCVSEIKDAEGMPCDRCEKRVTSLKLVRRVRKMRSFRGDVVVFKEKRVKLSSNEGRLRNICFRLKKLNKLSKF